RGDIGPIPDPPLQPPLLRQPREGLLGGVARDADAAGQGPGGGETGPRLQPSGEDGGANRRIELRVQQPLAAEGLEKVDDEVLFHLWHTIGLVTYNELALSTVPSTNHTRCMKT